MAQVIRFGSRRQPLFGARNLILFAAISAAIFALGTSYRDQFGELTATYRPDSRAPAQPAANSGPAVIKLGTSQPMPLEGALDASRVTVVDVDTIRIDGRSYRLVALD